MNSKINGVDLLLKTTLLHRNCFLPSVATDSKDGNGLKLEKIGQVLMSSLQFHQNNYCGSLSLAKIHLISSL